MKATVNKDTCVGCGLCEEICPEVFEMDDDNIAKAKVNPVPPAAETTCRNAAEDCPVEAIAITE